MIWSMIFVPLLMRYVSFFRCYTQTNLFKFTAFRTWTDNLGYEIDLCRFDFSTGLNFIDYLENGLEWINWNFQLFDLFLELYVKDQQTL